MEQPRKLFYGWVIVGACFLVMAVSMGIVTNCASLFTKPLCDDLGMSRQAAGWILTITYAGQMVTSLFSGKIFATFDVRFVMKICGIGVTIGWFLYSMASQLWQFYLISVLVGLCVGLVHMVPLSIIVGNWFHEKQGFALGIAFMGSGVGGMLFNSLTGVFLEQWGWRTAYQILAAIMFCVLIPVIFLVLRTRPEDMGLEPYGAGKRAASSNQPQAELEGRTFAQISGRFSFWAFVVINLLVGVCMNGLMLNISPHVSESGYSASFAANISALCMGSLAIGKFLLGTLYDRLSVKWATFWPYLCTVLGLLGAIFVRNPVALVVLVCCCGLGGAYGSVATPILVRTLYGSKDYGTIYGVMAAVMQLGSMITPVFLGAVFDATGSYTTGYWIMAVTTLVMGVFCMLDLRQIQREGKAAALKLEQNNT